MSALIAAFGIDWRLLVINIINFGLLLFALWYFLYGPLTTMLEKRREAVAQGVRDAERAKKHLEEIDASRADVMAAAGKEADDILARARKAGTDKERELTAQGEAAAQRIVAEAQAQAQEEKARAIAESKQEVAKLVVLGIEKTIREKA